LILTFLFILESFLGREDSARYDTFRTNSKSNVKASRRDYDEESEDSDLEYVIKNKVKVKDIVFEILNIYCELNSRNFSFSERDSDQKQTFFSGQCRVFQISN